MYTRTLLAGSLLLASTAAWSTDVHNQIGFMAEQFLTPHTASILEQILEPQYNGSIGRAAAWADGFAHSADGRYSYQWHWIDSHDNPPTTCSLNYTGDCSTHGCVVSAIANQTGILRECIEDVQKGQLSAAEGTNLTCSYALKWVTHFMGDIAQPLHASGNGAGGNRVHVIFNDVHTNLHSVWDHFIPYADAEVTHFSPLSIDPFFERLLARIRRDEFYEAPYMWVKCSDPSTALECATTWARETNAWNCAYVYSKLDNTTDLATSGYAVGAFPIIELQISKAALRLGTWLNKLVASVEQSHFSKADQQVVIGMDSA